MVNAKYNCGHHMVDSCCRVFRINDLIRESGLHSAGGAVCDADTLLPIIRQIVAVGRKIWLDEWHAYK